MVFFGRKSSRIKEGMLVNVNCPGCENNTAMRYAIFGKYAHIYWIPTFPTGKENILECVHCKRTYDLKELPDQIKNKFDLEKQDARFPIWYFSGLLVIAALIFAAVALSKQNSSNNAEFITTPEIGDIYSLKDNNTDSYTTMKLTKITTDSVFVVYNDYEISRRSKIYKIDKAENYTTETDGFSRAEILNLFEDKTIFDIDRD